MSETGKPQTFSLQKFRLRNESTFLSFVVIRSRSDIGMLFHVQWNEFVYFWKRRIEKERFQMIA